METRRTIREFWGCNGKVNDFCFSNDGRWVIAASQDGVIRVWDMPTSHLIDAIRLEKPCTALAVSGTGEYFAAAIEGELGVTIWTNKTLYSHVPTRQISEKEIGRITVPNTSGEGAQGLIEGAFEEERSQEDDQVVAPTLDQLSADMMTLSLVPKSRWQTLLHIDLIKQRNKPLEPPKAPEKAPFFLPSLNSAAKNLLLPAAPDTGDAGHKSRITTLDRSRTEEAFASKLREAAETGNCEWIAVE
jgi:U3 small nucleolar RNA-associated protein 21